MAERQIIRVQPPPPQEDKNVSYWQRRVTDALNTLPPFSVFSYTSPESNVTALRGTIGISMASSSSGSIAWIKAQGDDNTGWAPLATFNQLGSSGTIYSVGTIPQRSDGTIEGLEVWYYSGINPYQQSAAGPTSFAYSITSGQLNAFPFWSSSGMSVVAIAFRNTTGGGAGSQSRVGIYDTSDYSSLYPGTLVAQSSATSTVASNTLHAFTDFTANLEPQTLYWFAFLGNATITINGWGSTDRWVPLGYTANFGAADGFGWRVSQTFGSLPSSFPASAGKATNACLAIGVR